MDKIFSHDWEQIQAAQQKKPGWRGTINLSAARGDHGADPIGNGQFRMVPSGDIVDITERNRRLAR